MTVARGLLLVGLHMTLHPAVGMAETTSTRPAGTVELIQDANFRRGFEVYDPKPGKHVVRGLMRIDPDADEPIWGLAQWSSRYTLAGVPAERLASGAVRFADQAKAVTFTPAGDGLIFTLNGRREYGERFRRADEPWAHLLAEQRFADHPRVVDLERLRFRIECRLRSVKDYAPPDADLPGQAAQFLAYVTVQNLNRQSPGYGDYLWFGVQMYDSRYREPKAHAAADTGTGKFIYNPPGSAYTPASTHDGEWITIDRDLLPLIHEGLKTAWDQDHLKQSRDLNDFRLGGFNIGWELPGTLDVEIEFRKLSLEAVSK
ncbi:MAG: hypothetical protein GXY55_11440 [Phycisphaerae bacterium]|nr:hypothetical protein [Phycisphaerae bacterium]